MVLILIGMCFAVILLKGVLPSVVISYTLDRKMGKVERSPTVEFLALTFLGTDLTDFERRHARKEEEDD